MIKCSIFLAIALPFIILFAEWSERGSDGLVVLNQRSVEKTEWPKNDLGSFCFLSTGTMALTLGSLGAIPLEDKVWPRETNFDLKNCHLCGWMVHPGKDSRLKTCRNFLSCSAREGEQMRILSIESTSDTNPLNVRVELRRPKTHKELKMSHVSWNCCIGNSIVCHRDLEKSFGKVCWKDLVARVKTL